jgi:hypothetical protein
MLLVRRSLEEKRPNEGEADVSAPLKGCAGAFITGPPGDMGGRRFLQKVRETERLSMLVKSRKCRGDERSFILVESRGNKTSFMVAERGRAENWNMLVYQKI